MASSQNPFQPFGANNAAAPTGFQSYGANGQPFKGRSGSGNFFKGQKARYTQVPTVTPQESQARNTLIQNALQGLQDPNSPNSGLENRAIRQYNQQIVPGIAERFTSLGGYNSTGNALSSPAFATQVGQAGSGLAENLKDMRMQDLLEQLRLGFGQQFDTQYSPETAGFLQNTANNVTEGLTEAGLSWLRNPLANNNQRSNQNGNGNGDNSNQTTGWWDRVKSLFS